MRIKNLSTAQLKKRRIYLKSTRSDSKYLKYIKFHLDQREINGRIAAMREFNGRIPDFTQKH